MREILTLETALNHSDELWSWLADTGASKKEYWPMWDEYGEVQHHCFTCEYARQQRNSNGNGTGRCRCDFCPTFKLFGDCRKGQALGKWEMARTPTEKRNYAREVLLKVRKIRTILIAEGQS